MSAPDASADRCEVRLIDQQRVARGRQLLLDDETYVSLAEVFGALADSNRAKIVFSLMQQELCVCDIAAVLGISESAVSQHLRLLRTLRLVKNRREGKMNFYSLDDDHVRGLLDVCLAHIRHE